MNKDPQGIQQSGNRHTFVARVLVFIHYEQRLLLIRNSPTKRLWPNMLNGIGGHVEAGESIYDAALREVEEETGITAINNLQLTAIITIDTSYAPGILLFVFTAMAASSESQGSDEGELGWFDPYNLPVEELVEDLPDLLSRIMNEAAPKPIFGHYSYNEQGNLVTSFIQ